MKGFHYFYRGLSVLAEKGDARPGVTVLQTAA